MSEEVKKDDRVSQLIESGIVSTPGLPDHIHNGQDASRVSLRNLYDVAITKRQSGNILFDDGSRWRELAPGGSGAMMYYQSSGVPTSMTAGTQGSLIYFNSSGVPTTLSPGTSGQYLKTQGSGANPTWATPSKVAFGTLTDVESTATNNFDETINLGWQPDFVKLSYYIQAHDKSTASGNYLAEKGWVVYSGTTKIINFIHWKTNSLTPGENMSDDNGYPVNNKAFITTVNETSDIVIGDNSGVNGITTNLSLISISTSSFTVRTAIIANASNTSTARMKADYEAYKNSQ